MSWKSWTHEFYVILQCIISSFTQCHRCPFSSLSIFVVSDTDNIVKISINIFFTKVSASFKVMVISYLLLLESVKSVTAISESLMSTHSLNVN